MLDIKSNVWQFQIFTNVFIIWKTHWKLSMSRVNINCLMIWKKDDIQEEITFIAVTPLHLRPKCVFNVCHLIMFNVLTLFLCQI